MKIANLKCQQKILKFLLISIHLERISFKKKINLTIPIGSKITFVGKTGSGKTTKAIKYLPIKDFFRKNFIGRKDLEKNQIELWQAFCSYVPNP